MLALEACGYLFANRPGRDSRESGSAG